MAIYAALEPLTPSEVRLYYEARFAGNARITGRQWRMQCPLHAGKAFNFAIDPETGYWFCHSECSRGGDVFELDLLLDGGNFPDAKRRVFEIIGRPLWEGQKYSAPRFSEQQLGEAELFRTGFIWRMERALEALTKELWNEGKTFEVGGQIGIVTQALGEMWRMSSYEAADAQERMREVDPDTVRACIQEVRQTQRDVALVIAAQGTRP